MKEEEKSLHFEVLTNSAVEVTCVRSCDGRDGSTKPNALDSRGSVEYSESYLVCSLFFICIISLSLT